MFLFFKASRPSSSASSRSTSFGTYNNPRSTYNGAQTFVGPKGGNYYYSNSGRKKYF